MQIHYSSKVLLLTLMPLSSVKGIKVSVVARPGNKTIFLLVEIQQEDFLLSPGQWAPCSVHCLEVGVSQVQLAAHKDDRSSGAEVFDFRVPHGPHMVQRVWVRD